MADSISKSPLLKLFSGKISRWESPSSVHASRPTDRWWQKPSNSLRECAMNMAHCSSSAHPAETKVRGRATALGETIPQTTWAHTTIWMIQMRTLFILRRSPALAAKLTMIPWAESLQLALSVCKGWSKLYRKFLEATVGNCPLRRLRRELNQLTVCADPSHHPAPSALPSPLPSEVCALNIFISIDV